MSRAAIGACRRVARRAAPDGVTFPMSNYPYSPPSMPGRQTLADMVMFYGSAELRSRIRSMSAGGRGAAERPGRSGDRPGGDVGADDGVAHDVGGADRPDRGVAGLAGGDGSGRRAGSDVPGGPGDPVRDRPRDAAPVPAAADPAGAPRRHRLTSRALQPVTDRARAATNAARLAAELPDRALTATEVRTLRAWTSLAQWVGTERGLAGDRTGRGVVARLRPGRRQLDPERLLHRHRRRAGACGTGCNATASPTGSGSSRAAAAGDWIAAAPEQVRFDAVDIDPISVRVATALTGANVVESRIEEWHLGRSDQALVNGGYDVVVGNVPFSSHKPGVGNPHRDNLHNLAIARSVSMLRPGGVAAVLTSRFSLDSNDTGWRRRLAAEVDLVAALRLPSRTHREAGTDVVTDLLILRRPLPGEQRPSRTGWTSSSSPSTPTPPRPSTATGPTTRTMSSAASNPAGRTAERTSTSSPTGPHTKRSPQPSPPSS